MIRTDGKPYLLPQRLPPACGDLRRERNFILCLSIISSARLSLLLSFSLFLSAVTGTSQFRPPALNMDVQTVREHIAKLPRTHIGLYPTPFHQLNMLSTTCGVQLFLKREDLAGPSSVSGSKVRLSEFILGQAVQDGYTHIITHGAHLTNSGMQLAVAAKVAGLTPILYLTRDTSHHGNLSEYRGNLLLTKIMDVETHFLNTDQGGLWMLTEGKKTLDTAMQQRQSELAKQGHRALIIPAGGAHELGFIAHALTYLEIIENPQGMKVDYIYHTAGTGTALPGLIAAKLLTGHTARIRSIAVNLYKEGSFMSPSVIVHRVKEIFQRLQLPVPDDASIRAEIDVDNGFIGEDYSVPSQESIVAIQTLARTEGIFVGPVYTGKGFAGLLDHIKSGKIPRGSNVAFIHTGDTVNLFEVPSVVGQVTEPITQTPSQN